MKSTRLLESSALMILLSLGAISNPGTAHGQVFSPLFIDHIPLEDPSLTAEPGCGSRNSRSTARSTRSASFAWPRLFCPPRMVL